MRWIALFATTLLPLLAASDDWSHVKKLATGTNVTVVQTDMKSVRGNVSATSDNEIVVDSVTILKDRVVRVSSHGKAHRVRNAIALGIVGGVVGAGIAKFGIACAETNDGCQNAVLSTFGGIAVGAVGGALLPDTAEVYRVTSPRTPGH